MRSISISTIIMCACILLHIYTESNFFTGLMAALVILSLCLYAFLFWTFRGAAEQTPNGVRQTLQLSLRYKNITTLDIAFAACTGLLAAGYGWLIDDMLLLIVAAVQLVLMDRWVACLRSASTRLATWRVDIQDHMITGENENDRQSK